MDVEPVQAKTPPSEEESLVEEQSPAPTTPSSRFHAQLDPEGTWHFFCYFCGDEILEDEENEWGARAEDVWGTSQVVRAHRSCLDEELEWRDGDWRLKRAFNVSMTPPADSPPDLLVADLPKRTFEERTFRLPQPANIQADGKAVRTRPVPRSSGEVKGQVYRLLGRAYGERDGERYYGVRFYVTPNRYRNYPSAVTALVEYAKSMGVEPPPYLPLLVYAPGGRYYQMVSID